MPEPAVGIDRATAMQPVRVQLARVPVIVFDAPYGVKRLDPAAEPGMTFGFYPDLGTRTGFRSSR